uniref:NACHT LRR and PYD domain-containing protein n=1 Tax=Callorhinchus milii TaxID=7868 RepID=A0A4W3HLG6_CALMI
MHNTQIYFSFLTLDCRSTDVLLQDNGLTDDCTKDLVSALSTNHSLMELYLDNNKLGDLGMKRLSGALRKPECKIQKLEVSQCVFKLIPVISLLSLISSLGDNSLTNDSIEELASVLRTNSSLKGLNLDYNKLGDSGVKQFLCVHTHHVISPSLIFRLESNGLTGNGIKSLVSALSTNRSLTELHLDCNKLKDSGMKQLSDALRKPECKLERLWYVTRYEIVSVTTCYIPSILFSDYSYYYLKILVISEPAVYSNLYCVQMMWVILCSSVNLIYRNRLTHSHHCECYNVNYIYLSLISRLRDNRLTNNYTKGLVSALSINQSLTELYLDNNKLGDLGVKRLSASGETRV